MPHKDWFDEIGNKIPTVTQILGLYQNEELIRWRGRIGNDIADEVLFNSSKLGLDVHEKVENYFKNKMTVDVSCVAGKLAMSIINWINRHNFEIVDYEVGLKSKIYGFAGTFDAIGRFDNKKLWICDWKTSNRISKTYALQLAAYAWLYNENNNLSWSNGINSGFIVRPNKSIPESDPEIMKYENLEELFCIFICVKKFWNYINT
jgi:hypothetical protein